ncbi:MAG TPA: PTS glucose transporter subunit IIA [Cellulomonas sp.]
MTAVTVLAPVAGRATLLADVPDPVFAQQMVGPGIAVAPDATVGGRVLAPVAGTVRALHPHAFVLVGDGEGGRGVLVHLGIDTVGLHGEGFTLHVAEGDLVVAGQHLISWDPAAVARAGLSALCPVVALEADPATVRRLVEPGVAVAAGDPLLALD